MLSPKQKENVRFGESVGFLALSEGSIRSGKTHCAATSFYFFTQRLESNYRHLICGRSRAVLEAEILPVLQSLAQITGETLLYNKLNNILRIGKQFYHIVAGNDERSQHRIMGYTMHSALCDELTLVPQTFYDAMISRLSYTDSKLWATCNPKGPLHWVKTELIDKGAIDLHQKFTFEDNPTLSEDVKERYRERFAGVFLLRNVAGIWAEADGLIWPDYEVIPAPTTRPVRVDIGVDYGAASPSAFVAVADYKTHHIVVGTRVVAGSTSDARNDTEIADALSNFCELLESNTVILDPSAASLRAELLNRKRKGNFTPAVRKADNNVLFGLRLTGAALSSGRLKLAEGQCDPLIDEMKNYSWDDNREDTPIKANDHGCDALRYVAVERMRRQFSGRLTLPKGL